MSQSEFGDFPDAFRAARETMAYYLQAQGGRGRWDYSVGARQDENTAFGVFRTGRAGVAFRLTSALRVRANAGTAFKAPSFFENFAGGFTFGNPDLLPEHTRSADLGVEVALPRQSSVRVTAFAQKFRDLIQYTGAVPFGDPNYYNVAAANAGGVEFESVLPRVLGVQTSVGHTWTDTRVTDAGFSTTPEANFVQGGRLLRRPEHVTTVGLRRMFAGGHSISATAIRTGDREDRDFSGGTTTVVVLEPFTTVDLGADIRLPARLAREARLSLRADNALDVRTQQVAGFTSPGRVIYVGLKLERCLKRRRSSSTRSTIARPAASCGWPRVISG
jgi:vitamin B12 transporter